MRTLIGLPASVCAGVSAVVLLVLQEAEAIVLAGPSLRAALNSVSGAARDITASSGEAVGVVAGGAGHGSN